ncbi:MAG: UvrD-helicase domain-containing protein [bacterium]
MSILLENLNSEQKKAVTHENGPVLIVAGAGTGKTTVITKRIAWLIEQRKANPDEILALTFTDKAAGEMEERVDMILPYGYVDLWISTFHSFCDRILRDYALDIGLSSNYKLLNTTEQWMLVRKNLDRFNLDYYRPFGNPTKFIHALIKHFSRCKDEGISPEEYLEYAESLRLNWDNAESGADSLKFKVQSSKLNTPLTPLPAKGRRSKEGTEVSEERVNGLEFKKLKEVANAYHIYQQILLENNGLDFGDLIKCTLKLFKERLNILEIIRKKFKYILVDEFQDTNWSQYELIKMLAAPKNNVTCVADDDQSIYLFRGSSVNNVLQFSKDYPECEEVVLTKNYRSKQEILDLSYKFIQQNNPNRLEYHLNQDDIMRQRAKEKGIDLADYKNINKKLKANVDGNAIIEHLHCESLEDEVNCVIEKIMEIKQNLSAQDGSKEEAKKVEIGKWKLEEEELRIKNQELREKRTEHCEREVSWSDFAILVRANDTASPFINGLELAGIPYQFYSLRGLYNKPIILDICAYLRLLDNYHESIALYRVLHIPIWRIAYDDFSKLNYAAKREGKSLYLTMKDIVFGRDAINRVSTTENLEKIISLIEKHSKLAKEKTASHVLTAFLNDSGYLEYLVKNESKENVKSLKYISQFYKKIKEFESAENDPKLKSFMEGMEMELDAGDEGVLRVDPDDGPDMVKIMTIHGAKGLEFPYVFVVNLVDKKFPTIERKDPIEIPEPLVKEIITEGDIHLEEERRLFYVAMTRAKDGLFFTSAEDYGGVRKKKVSRFLTEMGYGGDKPLLERGVNAAIIAFNKSPAPPITQKMSVAFPIFSKFSYTQLAAFEKCPLQYKFAHIFKIPIKGKNTFSFGKTMHSTLQKFFALMRERQTREQRGLFDERGLSPLKGDSPINIPTEKDLLKIYEECWIDEWYEDDKQREEKKKTGRQALKEFYEIHKDKWPNVLYLEQRFNLKIGRYTIKGSIDRIDLINYNTDNAITYGLTHPNPLPPEANRIVEIVDYKTGSVKDEKSVEKDQLLIYQLAAQECLKVKPERLTFYYVENNKLVSFLGTDAELEKLKINILEKIEKIKNSDFEATPGWQCEWCDYKGICEYRG